MASRTLNGKCARRYHFSIGDRTTFSRKSKKAGSLAPGCLWLGIHKFWLKMKQKAKFHPKI
jgi:hypothetical protein